MRSPICKATDSFRAIMIGINSYSCLQFILLMLPFFLPLFITGEVVDYPTFVDVPNSWRNIPSSDLTTWETAGIRPILVNGMFVCGFHCSFVGESCLFAVSIFKTTSDVGDAIFSPQMVWSANRNNPVGLRALLQLTAQGNLILEDVNGALVWSPNTKGKSLSRLNLTAEGNLMLFAKTNSLVWQSFDHPTDSLVVGQKLATGQKLRSSVSTSNSSEGFFTLAIIDDFLTAYMEADPSIVYYQIDLEGTIAFQTGLFGSLNVSNSANFIQLGIDGHFKAYEWKEFNWEGIDILGANRCDYPLACGNYGICFGGGCRCPDLDYFRPINDSQWDLGCSAVSPISCGHADDHQSLIAIQDMDVIANNYGFFVGNSAINMSLEDCNQACLKNCSCKATFLITEYSFSAYSSTLTPTPTTYCSFLSEVLSFKIKDAYSQNISIFLKVQNSSTTQRPVSNKNSSFPNSPESGRGDTAVILGSSLGSIFGMILICTLVFLLIRKGFKEVEEDHLDHISGMPARFSFEDLKIVTKNFSNKLGEGGFGSVYQGMLPSGSEVAVKHLDGFGQVKKSFIAEVQTIGSIHHFNLVSLVGFCAQKYKRLLVYEYMPSGSLDRWIFNKNQELALGWQIRKKIILDIAKGLSYLHEECNQKIIHLDIKPQNILLDENFNAKVSDFGLSKLIGRDQSQVITTMRGTPGYMAPEWLSSVITEKVDVYSFGIVVLEILCGRRNVDWSQQEEDRHLLSLFKRKQEEGQLQDLVDKCSDDMQSNAAEVVEMMKVAAWCLQTDYARRPSMSSVVKALDGSADAVGNDHFLNDLTPQSAGTSSSTILPSMLSGPR